jgi:polyisoprenyl-phosphate glycosyltransferase
MISVVIPVYNEGKPLIAFCDEIRSVLETTGKPYELILVDDCSTDDSWHHMLTMSRKHSNTRIARFSRNFGQHSALTAGITLAKGDYITLMDCDGQDDPAYIPEMVKTLDQTQAEIVYGVRTNRQSSQISIFQSYLVNKLMGFLSGYKHDPKIGTYRVITRKVADAFIALPEKRRFLAGMFYWLGFEHATLEIRHRSRAHGKSKYNLRKLMNLAKLGILSSSTKILSIGTYIGFISGIISVIAGIYFIVQKMIYNVPLGFTAIVVSIFFVGSVIIFLLGIIGEYLGEIFHEVKGRPNYVIRDKVNFPDARV